MFEKLRIKLVNLLYKVFSTVPLWLVHFIQPKWITEDMQQVSASLERTQERIIKIGRQNVKLAPFFHETVYDKLPGGLLLLSDAIDNMYATLGGYSGTVEFFNKFAVDEDAFLYITEYFSILPKHIEKFGGITTEEDIDPVAQLLAKELVSSLIVSPLLDAKYTESQLVNEIHALLK